MGDEIDRAQAYDEFFLGLALRSRNGARGVRSEENLSTSNLGPRSSNLCEDCGEVIPEARRRAVPGATRCIACQTEFESIHTHWRAL